jgi:hypothetical protein
MKFTEAASCCFRPTNHCLAQDQNPAILRRGGGPCPWGWSSRRSVICIRGSKEKALAVCPQNIIRFEYEVNKIYLFKSSFVCELFIDG